MFLLNPTVLAGTFQIAYTFVLRLHTNVLKKGGFLKLEYSYIKIIGDFWITSTITNSVLKLNSYCGNHKYLELYT